jgi:hypothetical protein
MNLHRKRNLLSPALLHKCVEEREKSLETHLDEPAEPPR